MNVRKRKFEIYLRRLIREICGAADVNIDDALATAQLAHLGQKRRSGEEYIEHPKQVANIVYQYYQDPVLCAAALLHDTLEDAVAQGNAETDEEMSSFIAGSFGDPQLGDDVLRLIKSLTHEKNVPYTEYLLDLALDPNAIKVKLADMLHNASSSPSEKQLGKYRDALETLRGAHGEPPAGIDSSHWKSLKAAVGLSDVSEVLMREYRKTLREIKEKEQEVVRKPLALSFPDDLGDIHQLMSSAGQELYIVGGAVRDSLMGKTPKDYDVATNAPPEKVQEILSKDPDLQIKPVGEAFGVILVKTPAGNEYEIATFRKDIGKGRRPDSVEFTDIKTDVQRRDLTINALFYDMDSGEVVDYVGGIEDIEKGVIRAVGDPAERFDEDKLRILRAVRFAARMDSDLDPETKEAIKADNELTGVTPERIRDEFMKGISSAKSVSGFFNMLQELDLYDQIFPGLSVDITESDSDSPIVQIALLIYDNDPETTVKALKAMRYTNEEADTIGFLLTFKDITKEIAPKLKKAVSRVKIDPSVIKDFAQAGGAPTMKVVDAFIKFSSAPPAADPRDLMSQGLKGPDIGTAMQKAEEEAYAELTNEQILREAILRILNEGTEFHELDSPLDYNRASNVKRIAYCDTTVTEPTDKRDAYFKEFQEWEYYGSSGRRLKNARKGKLIPGVSNVCIIGFLDYHSQGKSGDGSQMWYIDYMKTRGDSTGQGVASKLIDNFYETIAKPGDNVHFGKMMRKEIGHLKDKMVDAHPEITTIGAKNF